MGDIYKIKEFGYLQKNLDMLAARQNATSANIANAETPGYKAVRLEFEKQLEAAIGKNVGIKETHPGHLPTGMRGVYGIKPRFTQKLDGARPDGNTVDLEKEFSTSAADVARYELSVAALNKHLKNVLSSLEEGGRK